MAEQILTPTEILAEKIAVGDLEEDAGQQATAYELDKLHTSIIECQSTGFLTKIIGRIKPVTGLYIYGGVGRGKTMLMDMFFQHCSLPPNKKKRVHFHKFHNPQEWGNRLLQ